MHKNVYFINYVLKDFLMRQDKISEKKSKPYKRKLFVTVNNYIL